MALPIRPSANSTPKPAGLPDLGALPDTSSLSLPALPSEETVSQPKQAPVRRSSPITAPTPEPQPSAPLEEAEDGWVIDPVTGKRHKELAGYKKGVMHSSAKIIKAGGLTLQQLRLAVDEDKDFDLDDLNGSAEMFLSHLRVPPNKEEQKRLIEERARRQKQYDRIAADEAREEAEREAAEEAKLNG